MWKWLFLSDGSQGLTNENLSYVICIHGNTKPGLWFWFSNYWEQSPEGLQPCRPSDMIVLTPNIQSLSETGFSSWNWMKGAGKTVSNTPSLYNRVFRLGWTFELPRELWKKKNLNSQTTPRPIKSECLGSSGHWFFIWCPGCSNVQPRLRAMTHAMCKEVF
jgi:hypothetical protein